MGRGQQNRLHELLVLYFEKIEGNFDHSSGLLSRSLRATKETAPADLSGGKNAEMTMYTS